MRRAVPLIATPPFPWFDVAGAILALAMVPRSGLRSLVVALALACAD